MSETITTFDRLRAIVKGKHLAEMTGNEAKLLLAFLVPVDFHTGQAFPAMETLAIDAGIANIHRARQAMKMMEERGILKEVTGSAGRVSKVRELQCPNHAPVKIKRPTSNRYTSCTGTHGVRDDSVAPTGTLLTINRDDSVAPTGTHGVPRTYQNRSKNNSKNKSAADAGEFPDTLKTSPDFLKAWSEWERYKRQKRQTITPLTRKRQLAQCEQWGPTRATQAIEASIQNGWTGLFEGNNHANGSTKAIAEHLTL